jgi:hypothetical protein
MAGRERIAWFEFEPAKPQRLRDGVREDFTAAVRRGGLAPGEPRVAWTTLRLMYRPPSSRRDRSRCRPLSAPYAAVMKL